MAGISHRVDTFVRAVLILAIPLSCGSLSGCLIADWFAVEPVVQEQPQVPSDPQNKPKTDCQAAVETADYRRLYEICKGDKSMAALAADMQRLFREVDDLISLYMNQIGGSPGYQPQLDAGVIMESAVQSIRSIMIAMERDAGQLRDGEWGDVAMYFANVTLTLQIGDLIDLSQPGEELKLNLKGEWNRVIVTLAGGGAAALLGFTDWLFAQSMVIDLDTSISGEFSTGMIADFLAHNPKLLSAKDPARFLDAARELAVSVSFLAGVTDTAPGWAGLLLTLDEQMQWDSNPDNNLISIRDTNHNGSFDKGDALIIEPIIDVLQQLSYFDNNDAIKEMATVENRYFSRDSLEDATAFGRAVGADLSGLSESPIPLRPYIGSFLKDAELWLQDLTDSPLWQLPEPLDWIALRPLLYFKSGLPTRELLPALYAINIEPGPIERTFQTWDGTLIQDTDGYEIDILSEPDFVHWEFLIECEFLSQSTSWSDGYGDSLLEWGSPVRTLCSNSSVDAYLSSKDVAFEIATVEQDPEHFVQQIRTGSFASAPIRKSGFVWARGVKPVESIRADGSVPTEDMPVQTYFGLQNPSFGGALLVDPKGTGAYAEADNYSLNKTLGAIARYFIEGLLGY